MFDGEQITITRTDWFISALALQKNDGTWLDSDPAWAANFRGDGSSTGTLTNGVPAEKFQAIRFRVGLSKAQNDSDPNSHEPDSALHPDICKMHWGWQGGYILMAIEGHRSDEEGFSYHLANNFDTIVEIPVEFDGTSPTTICLALHFDKVIADLDFEKDGTSTHSRDNDPLGTRLFKNAASAFSLISTSPDIFQQTIIKGATYSFTIAGRGISNYLGSAVISPDGNSTWIISTQDNIQRGTFRDGNDLTHDLTVRTISSRIDLSAGTPITDVLVHRIDHDNSGVPSTAVFDSSGVYLFTVIEGAREVAVSDAWSRT